MMFIKKFASIAALSLSAIASFSYAGSAHAVTFKVTTGIESIDGKTNQGAFSDFSKNKDVVTVDFNSGTAPTTGFAKYSFSGNGSSSVKADMWAPVGANGEKNDSNYLAVFNGNDVTINLKKSLNYFGIDWGAAHTNNTYSFYNGNDLVKSFTTKDIDNAGGFAIYSALHPGSNEDGAKLEGSNYIQGNGYVHFYSESSKDIFNKIVISQGSNGGGFETDNHSFHAGTKGFDFEKGATKVPEPGVALGLLAVGGVFLRKRKNQNSLNLG